LLSNGTTISENLESPTERSKSGDHRSGEALITIHVEPEAKAKNSGVPVL
jgi:hypothetical protein